MSKCVICGKYVDKSYGSSTLFGIYCECCAVARGLTDEQMIFEMKQKIADLEAKLAESEEDTNKWKSISERLASVLDRFHYLGETPLYNTTREEDKISFCIEQLDKVKEFVKENESWEIDGSDYSIVYADDVLEEIDNQINVLRNNKDGIH